MQAEALAPSPVSRGPGGSSGEGQVAPDQHFYK